MNDHLNVAVTISCTILRTVITVQVGTCVKIIAAIAIEYYDARFYRSCSLSMLRAWGSNPYGIVLNWPFNSSAWPVAVLTLCLIPTILGAQFVSTLLVSDLDSSLIAGLPQYATTLYTAQNFSSNSHYPPNYASYVPVGYPVFAEWSSDLMISATDGVDDTDQHCVPCCLSHWPARARKYRILQARQLFFTPESFA
jgi:hypothetical protein